MPSADFCSAVRPPFDSLSPLRTRSRSGVSSTAFRAQPPDLRFAPLMDMDFAVSRPLVRHSRLISDFCSSTRTFAIRFFQTPPRGGGPCVLARPSPPSGWPEDLHLQTAEHAQHTTKPLCGKPRPTAFPVCQGNCDGAAIAAKINVVAVQRVTHPRSDHQNKTDRFRSIHIKQLPCQTAWV